MAWTDLLHYVADEMPDGTWLTVWGDGVTDVVPGTVLTFRGRSGRVEGYGYRFLGPDEDATP